MTQRLSEFENNHLLITWWLWEHSQWNWRVFKWGIIANFGRRQLSFHLKQRKP